MIYVPIIGICYLGYITEQQFNLCEYDRAKRPEPPTGTKANAPNRTITCALCPAEKWTGRLGGSPSDLTLVPYILGRRGTVRCPAFPSEVTLLHTETTGKWRTV